MERKSPDKKDSTVETLLKGLIIGGAIALGAYLYGKNEGKEEVQKESHDKVQKQLDEIESANAGFEEKLGNQKELLCPITLSTTF